MDKKERGLSQFTKETFGIVTDKGKNGYPPTVSLGEARRIAPEQLKEMEQVDYDSNGNHYEIYEWKGTEENNSYRVRHYNYRGREVIRNPELHKPIKRKEYDTETERRKELPRWVEKESYWDKTDITKYVDNMTDEEIMRSSMYFILPRLQEEETHNVIKQMRELIQKVKAFDYKYPNESEYTTRVDTAIKEEMIPLVVELESLLPQIEESDAVLAMEILKKLDFDWKSIWRDYMRYNKIQDRVRYMHQSTILQVKNIRYELKRRVPLLKPSDGEDLRRADGIREY